MKNSIKKRGQKLIKGIARATFKAEEESREHIKENFIARLAHIGNIKLLILEWSLLTIALIMLALAQTFWFRSSYTDDVFSAGGSYTEATYGEVSSLNPLLATTNSEKVLSRLMFATVATVDYSGHTNVGLAESIWPDQDGKVWRVKLRDNLKWSDGEPITSQDLIFTANLIKNPRVNTVYATNLTNVTVEEGENSEVVFTLPVAYADFMSALNFPLVPMHILKDVDPQLLIETDFSNTPISSGAFMFNAMQPTTNADEKIYYLSANPNYYSGRTLLSSFVVHTYSDKSKIIDALNSGSVTATAELSGADKDKINAKQIREKNSSLSSGAFIFFNTAKANVKEKSLRAAIREGLNLEKIREFAPDSLALNYPLLESQIKLTEYPKLPSYNFEEAKAKLEEITKGEPITLVLATVNSGYLPNVANEIAANLRGLGINVDLSIFEENQEFIKNIVSKRNYDLLVYEVELGAEPDLLPYYHSTQATGNGLNLSNYRNVIVDDLLLSARGTLNQEQRVKKYETFLDYWVASVPAIGLYRPNLTYYYNQNIRPFGNNVTLTTGLDRFSDITNWAVNKTRKNKTP